MREGEGRLMSDLSRPYVDKAYRQGVAARKRGKPESANPYTPSGHPRDTTLDDEMHAAWAEGYEDEGNGEAQVVELDDIKIDSLAYRGFDIQVWRNANEETYYSLTFNTKVKSPSSTLSADFPDPAGALEAGKSKIDKRLARARSTED
jgi:hypothetical protein